MNLPDDDVGFTAFGHKVVLYSTGQAFTDYSAQFPDRRFWTRWIAWHPDTDNWLFWQYHDRGRIKGIDGDVDLDVLQGGPEVLQALLAEGGT